MHELEIIIEIMSVANLDMSLDDIIKQNKQEKKANFKKRFERRPFRQSRRHFDNDQRRNYKRDFDDNEEEKEESAKTRLKVSNLHYNITNDELKVILFS